MNFKNPPENKGGFLGFVNKGGFPGVIYPDFDVDALVHSHLGSFVPGQSLESFRGLTATTRADPAGQGTRMPRYECVATSRRFLFE